MELSYMEAVTVTTLENDVPDIRIVVKVSENGVSAADVYRRACDCLGVQEASREFFTLCVGGDKPTRKIKLTENLPLPVKDVYLVKWCFDVRTEVKLLQSGNSAGHLLFVQALRDVQTGKLQPSKEQQKKLDECLDPNFCMEKQFVQVCHTIDGYFTTQMKDCSLSTDVHTQQGKIPKGHNVIVYLSQKGLSFEPGHPGPCSWFKMKSWSMREKRVTFQFQPCHSQSLFVAIETGQAAYIVSVVMALLQLLRREDDDLPPFLASMVKSLPDGSTVWENSLFMPDN